VSEEEKPNRVNRTVYIDPELWKEFKVKCVDINESMTGVMEKLIKKFVSKQVK